MVDQEVRQRDERQKSTPHKTLFARVWILPAAEFLRKGNPAAGGYTEIKGEAGRNRQLERDLATREQ